MEREEILKALKPFGEIIKRKINEEDNYDDIIKMTEIIITNRLEYSNRSNIINFDVEISLGILCLFLLPGKPPPYEEAAKNVRKFYSGINTDKNLQRDFNKLITDKVRKANNADELDFNNIRNIFRFPPERGTQQYQ